MDDENWTLDLSDDPPLTPKSLSPPGSPPSLMNEAQVLQITQETIKRIKMILKRRPKGKVGKNGKRLRNKKI